MLLGSSSLCASMIMQARLIPCSLFFQLIHGGSCVSYPCVKGFFVSVGCLGFIYFYSLFYMIHCTERVLCFGITSCSCWCVPVSSLVLSIAIPFSL